MAMSDYTGLDDDDELSRFRAHEADELDATLDRESEDGRDFGAFRALLSLPMLLSAGVMVGAAVALVVLVRG
jgi:hypothetical protein